MHFYSSYFARCPPAVIVDIVLSQLGERQTVLITVDEIMKTGALLQQLFVALSPLLMNRRVCVLISSLSYSKPTVCAINSNYGIDWVQLCMLRSWKNLLTEKEAASKEFMIAAALCSGHGLSLENLHEAFEKVREQLGILFFLAACVLW